MNELQLPFAIYRKNGCDHYLLSDIYIHRAKVNVRMNAPSPHEISVENNRLIKGIDACWIAIFVDGQKALTLTGATDPQKLLWSTEQNVMRTIWSSPKSTFKTLNYHKDDIDCVIPVSSRLDCYCPHTLQLLSTTSLFSNYVTFPLRLHTTNFSHWLGVMVGHWKKCMSETIKKNKVFRLPPEVHLSSEEVMKAKSQAKDSGLNSIQSIINQIKRDVQHSTSAKRQRLSKGLLARHDED